MGRAQKITHKISPVRIVTKLLLRLIFEDPRKYYSRVFSRIVTKLLLRLLL